MFPVMLSSTSVREPSAIERYRFIWAFSERSVARFSANDRLRWWNNSRAQQRQQQWQWHSQWAEVHAATRRLHWQLSSMTALWRRSWRQQQRRRFRFACRSCPTRSAVSVRSRSQRQPRKDSQQSALDVATMAQPAARREAGVECSLEQSETLKSVASRLRARPQGAEAGQVPPPKRLRTLSESHTQTAAQALMHVTPFISRLK